jgi:predicted nucleic acid-binding protein
LIQVLDASVGVRWFTPDGDEGDAAAERLLRQVAVRPAAFVVPELFFHELFAVLCRRMRQARDVTAALDRVSRLGLRRVRLDERLVRRAARMAFAYRLGGHDACYAALAAELGGEWVTFDRAAHERVAALGVSRVP